MAIGYRLSAVSKEMTFFDTLASLLMADR